MYADITDEQAEALAKQYYNAVYEVAPNYGVMAIRWEVALKHEKDMMIEVMHKMFGRDMHYFIQLRNGVH